MNRFNCFQFCASKSSIEVVDRSTFSHLEKPEKNASMGMTSLPDTLRDVTWKTAVPYVPPVYEGKVIKVYDGDTITIATILPNTTDKTVYRFSVRLLGIDSAEIKGSTFAEKECAIKAREALAKQIMGKMVSLKNVSLEKYGRILADVYCNNVHINQWMIDNGLAVAYDGGTKHRPDEWL
jgi:endonuclease YncB( thermonuclease family)